VALLSEDQWKCLRRLYAAGKAGISHDGAGYGDAGSWSVILQLRDRQPPLVREVVRPDYTLLTVRYLVVITEAGVRFYEDHQRLHDIFYPPDK